MMKFMLEITSSNAAMQTPGDAATALLDVAELLLAVAWRETDVGEITFDGEAHTISDANGNTVGSWEIQ